MKRQVRAYTIIELLIVVMIMGMLLGISLPAFTKLAKGSGVRLAATGIAGKVSATRSYAVSQRRYAALVFPTDETGVSNDLIESYRYTKYRVCQVYYDTSNSRWAFKAWVDGENWEETPTGTLVYDVTGSGTVQTIYSCVVTDVQTSPSPVNMSKAIVFRPSGSIVADSCAPATISIKEGAVTTGGSLVITNTINLMTMTVNPFTCKVSYSGD